MKTLFISLTICFCILTSTVQTQELDANVTVNIEQLNQDAKINVSTLETDLENYINSQRYTETNWEGPKIPVEISVVISGGGGSRYNARLLVVSKRNIDGSAENTSVASKFLDDNWSFEYTRFASLVYNPLRYHEFTTLIDFYMMLVIGLDMDTYAELDGSAMFNKARQIFQLGASVQADGYGTFSSPGAYTKYNLITELNDMKYDEFRKLLFSYYVDGLDVMVSNKEQGFKNLAYVIKLMAEFKKEKLSSSSIFMQSFFEAKNLELSQIFKDYEDKSVYDNLIYLDPSNSETYKEARDGK